MRVSGSARLLYGASRNAVHRQPFQGGGFVLKTARRELLADEIRGVLRPGVTEADIRAVAEQLLALAA